MSQASHHGAIVSSIAVALSCGTALAQVPRIADGEKISYVLYLKQGLVTVKAGTANLAVSEKEKGTFEATLSLKASSVVEMFYHLDVRMATRLTPELKPLRFEKHAEEGSRVYDEETVFSYPPEGGCAVSSRRAFKNGKVDVGDTRRTEQVFDLVSLLFHARRLDVARLAPGARLGVPVISGVKVRDQSLVYKGEEEVETANGSKVMSGVFALLDKDGAETARFAFSKEGSRIPQRLDISLKFGSVSARLETPPACAR
jgi:hypothetical protein